MRDNYDFSNAVSSRVCFPGRSALPERTETPRYRKKTLDAMAEARRISRDSDIAGYTDMDDLKAALEFDG